MFSKLGDVQYMGGYHEYIGACSVHQGISLRMWGYHVYIWGCSVDQRNTMSKSGEYHEYIGGCSVHQRGYHDAFGGVT